MKIKLDKLKHFVEQSDDLFVKIKNKYHIKENVIILVNDYEYDNNHLYSINFISQYNMVSLSYFNNSHNYSRSLNNPNEEIEIFIYKQIQTDTLEMLLELS